METVALYAALAESIYRRHAVLDQALTLDAINQASEAGLVLAPQLTVAGVEYLDGYYYVPTGPMGGFHAQVLLDPDGKYIIVVRGTDGTVSGWSSVAANIGFNLASTGVANYLGLLAELSGLGGRTAA